jgi:fatty-acyl-CoA synthase
VNLFAVLDQAASRFADRGEVYYGDRRVRTWGELRHRALRLATSIRQQYGSRRARRDRDREPQG